MGTVTRSLLWDTQGMITASLLLTLALPPQATWYVDASAPGPGIGSPLDPYTRVDYAAAQSTTQSGDTLLISPGIYPAESIELDGKSLNFSATTDASQTVLEGNGQESILRIIGVPSEVTRCNGITFRGGRGTTDPTTGRTYGGAIYAETGRASLHDCVFVDCRADFGGVLAQRRLPGFVSPGSQLENCSTGAGCIAQVNGGVIHSEGTLDIRDCQLTGIATTGRGGVAYVAGAYASSYDSELDGFASLEGGALYVQDGGINVRRSDVRGSAAGHGGALCAERSSSFLTESTIRGASLGGGYGGGLYVSDSSSNVVQLCQFIDCSAHSGGAIYSTIPQNLLVWVTEFRNNHADGSAQAPGRGGAIFSVNRLLVRDSVFVGNAASNQFASAGGAIYGFGEMIDSTFVDNRASAVAASVVNGPPGSTVFSSVTSNCIFTGSLTGGVPHVDGVAPLSKSIVEGGAPGTQVLDADPGFWGDDDFHLLPDSPARRSNSGFMAGAFPFDPGWCGQNCDGRIGVVACTAVPNTSGQPAEISGLGSFDPLVDRLVINVAGVAPNTVGVLIASRTPGLTPLAGGMGTLCLGGSILRFPGVHVAGGQGRMSLRPVLSDFPSGTPVLSGDSWYFQVWYRESSTSAGASNFTPSLFIQY